MWKPLAWQHHFTKRESFVHLTSLSLPPFIVPIKESQWSCICALGVSILTLSMILIFDFWIWQFSFYEDILKYIKMFVVTSMSMNTLHCFIWQTFSKCPLYTIAFSSRSTSLFGGLPPTEYCIRIDQCFDFWKRLMIS